MIQLNHSYSVLFAVTSAGVGTAADSTPTAVLYRNGSASGVTVTVSTTAQTGLYKATFTTNSGWSSVDHLELYATATISGTSGYLAKVWSSTEYASTFAAGSDAVIVGSMQANTLTAAALAADAGAELAALVESYIVNEGDATAVMQAIADKIAADWVAGDASPLAIIAALKADATLAQMIARIDATVSSRLADADYTAPLDSTETQSAAAAALTAYDPPTNAEMEARTLAAASYATSSALSAVAADVTTLLSRVTTTVATLWANLTAMITGSGGSAAFTPTALANAPAGGGGAGDASQETLEEVQSTVNLINAKTQLITGPGVSVVSPVTQTGDLISRIGDDDVGADALPVFLPGGAGDRLALIDADVSKIYFVARRTNANDIRVEVPKDSILEPNEEGKVFAMVEIPVESKPTVTGTYTTSLLIERTNGKVKHKTIGRLFMEEQIGSPVEA